MTGIDPDRFRHVLGGFATGVSVMTTRVEGVPHGMTANAVSSVSLAPALVLVCVAREAWMASQVEAAGAFALSFLAADQRWLSDHFADPGRPSGEGSFAAVATRDEVTGSPVLDGNVGWVDCRVWSIVDGGDHLIVVGEVLGLGADADPPLLYHRGAYGRFEPTRPAVVDPFPDDRS